MENWHNISKHTEAIDNYIEKIKSKIDEVVAFGGGSTIDIGKYIAYKMKISFTCIPSMLSTNTFATNKVALLKQGNKVTLNSKIPEKIIIDNDILKLSQKENLYGLADVLSIYTALYDWEIANKYIDESIDEKIYNNAKSLLLEVIKFVNENPYNQIISDNMGLFKYIGEAGYITNLYGSGRPESGSEHIMAKEIESKINIPHGMSVSIGILLMSLVQERYSINIEKAIRKMKIFEYSNNYGLTKELIKKCLFNIKPREDRYTIINRNLKNNKDKEAMVSQIFKIVEEVK